MEKEYNFDEENIPNLSEPMAEYGLESDMEILPALTEEELAECMTGEEFLDAVLAHIDKLFDKK